MSSYPEAILILGFSWFLKSSLYIFDKSPMTSAWRHLHKHKTCWRRPGLSESVHSKSSRCCPSKASFLYRNPKVNKIVGNIGSTKSNQWDEVSFSDNYIKKEHVVLFEFFLTLWGSAGSGLRGGLTLGVSLPWKNSLAGCTHEVKRVGHSIFTKCSIHDYSEALHLLWHTWPLNRSGISWPNMSRLALFDADSGW